MKPRANSATGGRVFVGFRGAGVMGSGGLQAARINPKRSSVQLSPKLQSIAKTLLPLPNASTIAAETGRVALTDYDGDMREHISFIRSCNSRSDETNSVWAGIMTIGTPPSSFLMDFDTG